MSDLTSDGIKIFSGLVSLVPAIVPLIKEAMDPKETQDPLVLELREILHKSLSGAEADRLEGKSL